MLRVKKITKLVVLSNLIIVTVNALLLQSLPTQAQRISDSERTPDHKQMFVGIWTGEGYRCGETYYTEKVKTEMNGDFLIATKITGDACVPKGLQTFSGKVPKTLSKGKSFMITHTVGSPDKPASGTMSGQLTIVNVNTFITEIESQKVIFTRD